MTSIFWFRSNCLPKSRSNKWTGKRVDKLYGFFILFSRIFIPDQLAKEKRKIDNLVAVTLLVPEMEKFARINQAYVSYFGINPPVRVCVENSEKLLRLTAIGNDKNEVGTMHVQSISHWAPANIGPYSQATKVCTKNDTFFLWKWRETCYAKYVRKRAKIQRKLVSP